MCGIAGLLARAPAAALESEAVLMLEPLSRRGPDDRSVWTDAEAGVSLVHTRLSIIDLSTRGRQPMVSESGRYVITFNGEIYNFRSLRIELEGRGHRFISGTDTEVVLAAFEEWQPAGAVTRLIGMFAIGVWDRLERKLLLIRDRLGKKPLCFGIARDSVAFGSLVTCLERLPRVSLRLDPASVAAMLAHGYVPGDRTIYQNVVKVRPGTLVSLTIDGVLEERSFWEAPQHLSGVAVNNESFAEATRRVTGTLRTAVADRMVADVPIGLFLSGGIDSTVVAALMQAAAGDSVRTFTAGFESPAYDESPVASAVARHLGTRHETLYLSNHEIIETATALQDSFDEPFADPSAIPLLLLARAARRHVTVALAGDGGDEVFGGYNRHTYARKWWPLVNHLPLGVRRGIGRMLAATSPDRLDAIAGGLANRLLPSMIGLKVQKLASVLAQPDLGSAYLRFLTSWTGAFDHVVHGSGTALGDGLGWSSVVDARSMMYADLRGYMVDDVMVKVDRATMASGLEARSPLLDHRAVELAAGLESAVLFAGGKSKALLRAIAERYVPRDLLERPKAGFAPPLEEWLRGPLRPWAEDLLTECNLKSAGLVEPAPVRLLWKEHLSRKAQRHYPIWTILCLHSWAQTRRNHAQFV